MYFIIIVIEKMMKGEMKMLYRHELKHQVSMTDYCILRNRLKYLMNLDPHSNEDGFYLIRSLYFDNAEDKALREKIDGVDNREKFRIRFYNNDTSYIRLEKKSKQRGLNNKLSEEISYEEAMAIIECKWDKIKKIDKPLVKELYAKMQNQRLRPRTIVQYKREAYIYPAGNVRITFDTELKTGLYSTKLFDPNVPMVTPMEPVALLEVKYDEFIPDNIVKLLQISGRQRSSFSKYAACRIYG